MVVYSDISWKNIDGRYQKGDPRRYLDKTAPLQSDYTGGELRCYEDCQRQEESIETLTKTDIMKKNEFKTRVDTVNNRCYCSFRPKSKAQIAYEKKKPTIVELNNKHLEMEMMMREYRNLYDEYVRTVSTNTLKDTKIYRMKNVKEFYDQNPTVRYVKIRNRRNQYLHIQEIEVYDQDGKNVAINQSKPKLHWYTDCNQCGKNVCDSKNYTNMSTPDINRLYFTGGHYNNNSKSKGGPGRVSEVGCCDIDENQKAIRDTYYGAIYGVGKHEEDDESKKKDKNETTVKVSSTGWWGNADSVIDGMKADNASWPDSNHTRREGIQWIELDLKKDVDVRKIVIYNRHVKWRLHGAAILLYNNKRERVHAPIRLGSGRVQSFPVNLKRQPKTGLIKQLFLNSVTQKQCFDDCADDEECKYVLFKREWYNHGRGWRRRGRCLKYDESADGLIDIKPQDRRFAWNAWEKDTWDDYENKNIKSGSEWSVNLGRSTSLKACKNTAIKSDEGPFSSVVFVDDTYKDSDKHNTCYGNSLGEKDNLQESEGVHSSIPPGGETGKIDEEEIGLLTELITLNKKISGHIEEIGSVTQGTVQQGKSNVASSQSVSNIYSKESSNRLIERLNNDRIELERLTKEIEDTNARNDFLELSNTSNKTKLYITGLVAILLVSVVLLYFGDSVSSTVVAGILVVMFLFMYLINYKYYNTIILRPFAMFGSLIGNIFNNDKYEITS
tara:strand:+ start:3007 stop:5181 length:2175 start_codon:yes stop_codon:yes gene_type:complete